MWLLPSIMNIENVGALAQSLKESIHKRGKIKSKIINVSSLIH